MGTTLQHGIFLPAEGERNCYEGLAANWVALDGLIGGYSAHAANLTIHVTAADKEAWNGKADASALTAHTGNTTIHVTAEDKNKWDAVDNKADASALTAHTGDTTIHVTAADKEAWNGKADTTALTAHTGDTTIHVTAEDKTKWDAVTGKADDASVMHLTGDETSTGIKGFLGTRTEFKRTNGDGVLLFGNGVFTKGSSINDSINICRKYYGDATSIGSALGYSSVSVTDQGNRTMFQFYCIANTAGSTTRTTLQLNYDKSLSGADAQYLNITGSLLPSVNNTYSLGNSSSKWKQLNGISPGALSLPDFSAGVDISAYITDITGASNINKFTPTADGWISIGISNAEFIELYIPSALMGGTFTKTSTNNYAQAFMPVIANKEVRIALKGATIGWAKFYPCQGNV